MDTVRLPAAPWPRPFRLFYLDHQAMEEISTFKAGELEQYDGATSDFGHPIGLYDRHDGEWNLFLRDHPKQTLVLATLLGRAVLDMVECERFAITLVGAIDVEVSDGVGLYQLGGCNQVLNRTADVSALLESTRRSLEDPASGPLLRVLLELLNATLEPFGFTWSVSNSAVGNLLAAVRLASERPILVGERELRGRCVEMPDGGLVWWAGRATQYGPPAPLGDSE